MQMCKMCKASLEVMQGLGWVSKRGPCNRTSEWISCTHRYRGPPSLSRDQPTLDSQPTTSHLAVCPFKPNLAKMMMTKQVVAAKPARSVGLESGIRETGPFSR